MRMACCRRRPQRRRIARRTGGRFRRIYLTGAFGASPCESYWLSDDHLVCQDAMFDCARSMPSTVLPFPTGASDRTTTWCSSFSSSRAASKRPPD
jgi:hypothetical protein